MSDQTGIQWCDATFNPWIGCEKVSPGCAHCYAETLVTGRMARPGTWGADGVRQVTSDSNWKKPPRWARLAREGRLPDGSENPDGRRPRVFCASLADVFEERPELEEPRRRLFDLIEQTTELDWLVLTKRPEYAADWLSERYARICSACGGDGCLLCVGRGVCGEIPPSVWLGVSIENSRYTWRADVLRQIPAAVRFISAEPLLGSLYTTRRASLAGEAAASAGGADPSDGSREDGPSYARAPLDLTGIDWVIVGGESGPVARPFRLEHAREILDACRDSGTAPFVKQLGAKPIDGASHSVDDRRAGSWEWTMPLHLRDRKGGDPDEWPADLRVREFPVGARAAA